MKPIGRYGAVPRDHGPVRTTASIIAMLSLATSVVLVSACAGTTTTSELTTPVAQGGNSLLSEEERGLDCKKITGRMQVRILQVRDHAVRKKSSSISRGLQSAVEPIFGGGGQGNSTNSDIARDHAKLHAMNGLLRSKNCASFDLAQELQPKEFTETPRPTVPPSAKRK